MDKFVIGVWQGKCKDGDVAANIARTRKVIDEAAAARCDIVCLPEVFLSGMGKRVQKRSAMTLNDPRLLALARHAGKKRVTTLVGLTEKRGKRFAVTQVVLSGGRVAGHYTKTMPTEQDWDLMRFFDDELPVFQVKGVKFGVIICHDSSFPEVAATLAWKGARIIFSPHYNGLPRNRMDSHRTLVRNNHVGVAAHYNVVVARSNVVGHWPQRDSYGYGDSAIFGPDGAPLAEAGLFTEKLVICNVAPYLAGVDWRSRTELRPAIIDQLHAAALAALKKKHRHAKEGR